VVGELEFRTEDFTDNRLIHHGFFVLVAHRLLYLSGPREKRAAMRHERFWIAGAASVLMATACNDASSITGPHAPQAGKPAFALFSYRTREQDVPWNEPVTNPCNGAEVLVDGKSHHVMSVRLDNALGFHLNWNVSSSGTGLGPGKTYKVSGEDNSAVEFPDPISTSTFVHKLVVIGPQQEDNFVLHMTAHVTVNVNDPDSPSAAFDHMDAKCTG
jgi:hypothetical protein